VNVRAEGQRPSMTASPSVAAASAGHGERRALIVISDGGTTPAGESTRSAPRFARQSDAVIYAMAFWGFRPAKKKEDEACSSGCARTARRGVFSKDHQRNRGCIRAGGCGSA